MLLPTLRSSRRPPATPSRSPRKDRQGIHRHCRENGSWPWQCAKSDRGAGDESWLAVAMPSSLAGNLTHVGSVANLIVVQVAHAHERAGQPMVTIPSASDANQFCQVSEIELVAPCNKANPRVPPIPDTAAATTACSKK